MIGLAQPQTTSAMGYKGVSQPYTNYLNVTTIKTTFLTDRSPALSREMLAPNEIKSKYLTKKYQEKRPNGCFMEIRKFEGVFVMANTFFVKNEMLQVSLVRPRQ